MRTCVLSLPLLSLACAILAGACEPGPGSGEAGEGASTPPGSEGEREVATGVEEEPLGELPDGTPVELHTLRNRRGMEVRAMTYGGIILSLKVPDRRGELEDVVLGYDGLEGYLEESPYFGAIIGRYGNRIAGGSFQVEGQTYSLATNDGPNHLHGGLRGFDKVVWNAEPFQEEGQVGVVFSRTSPHGEEGYPGNLDVRVTYPLTDANELVFDYRAVTDRTTPVNLTQHSYFNLAGDGSGDVGGHLLAINASRFTPVDETLIPTGELAPVEGTPFDFRRPHAMGERIEGSHPQLRYGGGYDHNFVLDRERGPSGVSWAELGLSPLARDGSPETLIPAVRVVEPESGRVMEVWTTEPGVQFYSGNFLDGTIQGKKGRVYEHRYGFCLETQHFPDSPNQPAFPSTLLRPGEEYRSRTVYVFGVGEELDRE